MSWCMFIFALALAQEPSDRPVEDPKPEIQQGKQATLRPPQKEKETNESDSFNPTWMLLGVLALLPFFFVARKKEPEAEEPLGSRQPDVTEASPAQAAISEENIDFSKDVLPKPADKVLRFRAKQEVGLRTTLQHILQNWVDWKDKLGSRPAVLRFEQQVIPLLEEECRMLDSWEDLSEAERNRWLQSDFLFILDEFSALYSSVCCWNFDGEEVAFSIKQGMEKYLYQDINRSVQKRGWFQLDVIIPFDTEFDNDVHQSVDVDRRYDCEQKIVRVDHVGLKSMEGHPMRIARVVISA